MSMQIQVPGVFDPRVGFVDVETEKVLTPDDYWMPNGERLAKRWSVIAAGIASDGLIEIVYEGDEEERLRELGWRCAGLTELRYSATRQFDEMVLRGRFTNARRAHLPEPTFPAMPGAERAKWKNCTRKEFPPSRHNDMESKLVPAYWAQGARKKVLAHLLRDVVELILLFGNPDPECEIWCYKVLQEPNFAEWIVGDRT